MVKLKETETMIQSAVCDYLALKKHFFWRNNTTGIYDAGKMVFRRKGKYEMNGIPDIIVIRDGFFIGLEIKSKTGKLSEGQKEFQRLCQENGAEYVIVRSINDVIEIGL